MAFLLDACALIAFARDEDGAEEIERMLESGGCHVHSLNIYEIFKDCLDADGDVAVAQDLLNDIRELVSQLDSIDVATAEAAARIKVTWKMAIPDAIGIAVAEARGLEFVTADHGELTAPMSAGKPIRFFR